MAFVGKKFPNLSVAAIDEMGDNKSINIFEEATKNNKKVLLFWYPKDFTFVCPTEIAEFGRLAKEFEDRDAIVLGGSTDNEFCKLAWRRDHPDLDKHPAWSFADTTGSLLDGLGVRAPEGVALRATYVVDPHNVIQHVYVTNLNVGRNPQDTLRVLDALQTDELCPCNRPLGGDTL